MPKGISQEAPSNHASGSQYRREGDTVHGWCDLVCEGTGKRGNVVAKELWDGNVDIFWQKKAWVNTEVMKQIARKFVRHKINVHGEDI